MQVQAAIAEARAAGRVRENLENGHASSSARSSTPRAGGTGAGSSSGIAPPLAEGTETALLYVRFRAAAEPGLKGIFVTAAVPGRYTGSDSKEDASRLDSIHRQTFLTAPCTMPVCCDKLPQPAPGWLTAPSSIQLAQLMY